MVAAGNDPSQPTLLRRSASRFAVTRGIWQIYLFYHPLGRALLRFHYKYTLRSSSWPVPLLPRTPGCTSSWSFCRRRLLPPLGDAFWDVALYLLVSLLFLLCLGVPCGTLSAVGTEEYKRSAAHLDQGLGHIIRRVAAHISYLTTLCDQLAHSDFGDTAQGRHLLAGSVSRQPIALCHSLQGVQFFRAEGANQFAKGRRGERSLRHLQGVSNTGANAWLEDSTESGDSGRSVGQRRVGPLACVHRSDRD
eukprot:6204101-Pleurochrysis_carterae.AAC.2